MATYAEFFLSSPARVKQYELLEISHPNFSQIYCVVRNKVGGVTVQVDGGSQTFSYYPLRITPQGVRNDLDYGLQVDLGDLGQVIPEELNSVAAAGGWQTKPTVRYWTFRSDDLANILFGPISLQITDIAQTREGSSFTAAAPSLNSNRTGEMYLPSRFPMIDGLL